MAHPCWAGSWWQSWKWHSTKPPGEATGGGATLAHRAWRPAHLVRARARAQIPERAGHGCISRRWKAGVARAACAPAWSCHPPVRPPSKFMTASAVTVLPQPDPPTIESVSAQSTWNDTPWTARTRPAGTGSSTLRSSTVSARSFMWISRPLANQLQIARAFQAPEPQAPGGTTSPGENHKPGGRARSFAANARVQRGLGNARRRQGHPARNCAGSMQYRALEKTAPVA